jgi:hypothetical protein
MPYYSHLYLPSTTAPKEASMRIDNVTFKTNAGNLLVGKTAKGTAVFQIMVPGIDAWIRVDWSHLATDIPTPKLGQHFLRLSAGSLELSHPTNMKGDIDPSNYPPEWHVKATALELIPISSC